MKIDSTYKPAASALPTKPAAAQSSAPTSAQDEVSLSKLAGALQSGEHPPVNTARIQEIKQAISEGRFKINPEAIADHLIESARELLSNSKQRQA